MKRRHPSWRLWIRVTGSGEPVAGSDQWRKKKPSGRWVDITNCARLCCNPSPDVEITGLIIVPESITMAEGDIVQLIVYAIYSDGTYTDVTDSCDYSSSDSDVVTVDANGAVDGEGSGDADITVVFSTQIYTIPVQVLA